MVARTLMLALVLPALLVAAYLATSIADKDASDLVQWAVEEVVGEVADGLRYLANFLEEER